jgi:hypothetical protein
MYFELTLIVKARKVHEVKKDAQDALAEAIVKTFSDGVVPEDRT